MRARRIKIWAEGEQKRPGEFLTIEGGELNTHCRNVIDTMCLSPSPSPSLSLPLLTLHMLDTEVIVLVLLDGRGSRTTTARRC